MIIRSAQLLNNFFAWFEADLSTPPLNSFQSKFQGLSLEDCKVLVMKRLLTRHEKHAGAIGILRIDRETVTPPRQDPYYFGRVFYELKSFTEGGERKIIVCLHSRDNVWAGVEIQDPESLLEPMLDNIVTTLQSQSWEEIQTGEGIKTKAPDEADQGAGEALKSKLRNMIREKLEDAYGTRTGPNDVLKLVGIKRYPESGTDGRPSVTASLEWTLEDTRKNQNLEYVDMRVIVSSKLDIDIRLTPVTSRDSQSSP